MVEVEFDRWFTQIAELCVEYVGPQKFYLHNRIGGDGWDVRPFGGNTLARFDDPKMATFIRLKIQ